MESDCVQIVSGDTFQLNLMSPTYFIMTLLNVLILVVCQIALMRHLSSSFLDLTIDAQCYWGRSRFFLGFEVR